MKCSEVNLSENSDCCCNVKDTPQNKCCSTEENPSEHACYQCNNNIAFVPEEKIVLPKQNEFKHFNIFETFQVSSDELIKPFNTLFVEKYPKLSYSLLTYIVVLRI